MMSLTMEVFLRNSLSSLQAVSHVTPTCKGNCRRASYGHPSLTSTVYCPHVVCYGFDFIAVAEYNSGMMRQQVLLQTASKAAAEEACII